MPFPLWIANINVNVNDNVTLSVAVACIAVLLTLALTVVILPMLSLSKRLTHNEKAAKKALKRHLLESAAPAGATSDHHHRPSSPLTALGHKPKPRQQQQQSNMGIILYSFPFSVAPVEKGTSSSSSSGGDKKGARGFALCSGSPFIEKIEYLARAHGIPYVVVPTLQNGKGNGKLPRAKILTTRFKQQNDGGGDGDAKKLVVDEVEIEDSNAIIQYVVDNIKIDGVNKGQSSSSCTSKNNVDTAIHVAMEALCEDRLYWCMVEERFRKNPNWLFDNHFNGLLPIKSKLLRWLISDKVVRASVLKALHFQGMSRYSNDRIASIYFSSVKALADLIQQQVFECDETFLSHEKVPGPTDLTVSAFLKVVRDAPHLDKCKARDFCKSNPTVGFYLMGIDMCLFAPPPSFAKGKAGKDGTAIYIQDMIQRRGARPFDAVGYLAPSCLHCNTSWLPNTHDNSGTSSNRSWSSLPIANAP